MDGGLVQVTCKDAHGRRGRLTVGLVGQQVLLISPSGEVVRLGGLQVGRLRGALRDALRVSVVREQSEQDVNDHSAPQQWSYDQ